MSIRSIVIIIVVKKSYNKSHPTLPRLSLSTSIIPLYPTCSSLTCLFNSTPFIPHYPTNVTPVIGYSSVQMKHPNLPDLSNSTPIIQLNLNYPILSCHLHSTLPNTFCPTHPKKYKREQNKNTINNYIDSMY